MIRLDLPVIVEGKYDKITLENVIEGLIIPTDGFGIFKNKEKCDMIRSLARLKGGIVIMTDSDSAGNIIRAYIKKQVGQDCNIYNVYVPCLKGKEKRKTSCGKEGLLGVEGMTREVLEQALRRSGIDSIKQSESRRKITKIDLFQMGFSGCSGAYLNRRKLLGYLELPQSLSPNALLDVLNTMLSYEEFTEVAQKCLKQETKS